MLIRIAFVDVTFDSSGNNLTAMTINAINLWNVLECGSPAMELGIDELSARGEMDADAVVRALDELKYYGVIEELSELSSSEDLVLLFGSNVTRTVRCTSPQKLRIRLLNRRNRVQSELRELTETYAKKEQYLQGVRANVSPFTAVTTAATAMGLTAEHFERALDLRSGYAKGAILSVGIPHAVAFWQELLESGDEHRQLRFLAALAEEHGRLLTRQRDNLGVLERDLRQAEERVKLTAAELHELTKAMSIVQMRFASRDSSARCAIPESVRHEVWRRDQGRCVVCSSQQNLEFDHVIPVSKGGSNTSRNLQLLCEMCNRTKGASI